LLTEVRSLRDRDLGTLRQQHPDGNLQSPPGSIRDTDRPISSLRSAKNPQGNTMKRVKGVEDLNICIIGAQGIVGVGANTLIGKAYPAFHTAAFSLGSASLTVASPPTGIEGTTGVPTNPGRPGMNTSRSRRRGCGGWKARRAWKSQ